MVRNGWSLGGLWLGVVLVSCGGESKSDPSRDGGNGGAPSGGAESGVTGTGGGNGGAISGGSGSGVTGTGGGDSGGGSTGGRASTGSSSGGSGTGGTTGDGGTPIGGTSAGGSHSGGAATGVAGAGGASSGGALAGGGGGAAVAGDGGLPPGGASTGGEGEASMGGATTGGTTTGGTTTGGTTTGGTTTGGTSSGGTGGVAGGGGMMGCYVAVRVDECCSRPVAADSLSLGDPCLVPYDDIYTSATLEACPDAERCLAMDCTYFSPPSRVVTRSETGTCVLTDECETADHDCVVAIDYSHCCSCEEVFPLVVVETDPCIARSNEAMPNGCADCSTVDCGPCPTDSLFPVCTTHGEISILTCTAVASP